MLTFFISDRQKSANEGSINFSPFSRILCGGLVKLHGTYDFVFLILQDSTPKVELLEDLATVSSQTPVLKKTVENEIEAMHNSRYE